MWRVTYLVLAIAAAVLVWKYVFASSPERLDCMTASRTAEESVALLICQREYEEARLPITGARVADLLRRTGNDGMAKSIAESLRGTDAEGVALQTLAKIAEAERKPDQAIELLQQARKLHRAQGDHVQLARDAQALARLESRQGQYAEALQLLEECIAESRVGSDTLLEGYCHLGAASVLKDVGHFEAAQQELDRAAEQLPSDRDRAQLWYERGNFEQEVVRGPSRRARHEQAIVAFERSLEYARRARFSAIMPNLHFNLAYSLAEVGRTQEADHHLADGAVLDREGRYESERAQLAARIAYRRNNLDLAYTLNARLKTEEPDERMEVCVMQARIALARNDLGDAEKWARCGRASAEQIRAGETATELRPWILASRREPFEVLFTVLVRGHRLGEAFSVFDQWQGRTLLDEMARPSRDPSLGLLGTAGWVQRVTRWLPAVAKAPLMTSAGRMPTQLGNADLIALALAEDEVWRLVVSRGRIRIDSLGKLDELKDSLTRFRTVPTEPMLAGVLGELILPDELVRRTDEPLYVVLDAPFALLPFAALRRTELPVIAMRPVLRAPRLPDARRCGPGPVIDSARVLADAAGDLPEARRESGRVASLFGTTPLVGDAATSTALFTAKSDPLLHVAVHADIDSGGGVLKLHDRAVSAAEISANRLGPRLVVLSACSTAGAWDPEMAGSLSTAFLAAGSNRVVATLRPVSDRGAIDLTSRFYEARGADDPVRVLAKVQTELARTDNTEWPNFAVFGNEICLPAS